MTRDLEHYLQLARQANAAGDHNTVAMIVTLKLEPLFGDDHCAARAFYTELEQTARVSYSPMMED
jgi:hypothetical protein